MCCGCMNIVAQDWLVQIQHQEERKAKKEEKLQQREAAKNAKAAEKKKWVET